ncbi:MAG: metallophosphoesterase [Spirochaetales bacterium]|jgi:DNA repair exonuclease SbcCD nuclease subunit|nr:metallophosphoesterase [Spirochaetales bacterium]
MKFLLCADLHIAEEEKDYSFGVLREIFALCSAENCGALFFAGDVFNSWADMEALRAEFRGLAESLPSSCAAYFVPGNHEELRGGPSANIGGFDFGRVRLLAQKPWQIETLCEGAELLALPFQKNYSGYRDWRVPSKKKPLRIALGHGTVPGIAYTGPDEEEPAGVLDADLFGFLDVDLAALGHLHGGAQGRAGKTLIAYPGSARVWREGETGPRRVLLGSDAPLPLRLEAVPLASAGEYRALPLYVSPSGSLTVPENIRPSAQDWLKLEVSGFVEDERPVIQTLDRLKGELEKKCRRVTVSHENLSVLAGLSSHPLALAFLKKWEEEAKKEGRGLELMNLARLKGLAALKAILESRR